MSSHGYRWCLTNGSHSFADTIKALHLPHSRRPPSAWQQLDDPGYTVSSSPAVRPSASNTAASVLCYDVYAVSTLKWPLPATTKTAFNHYPCYAIFSRAHYLSWQGAKGVLRLAPGTSYRPGTGEPLGQHPPALPAVGSMVDDLLRRSFSHSNIIAIIGFRSFVPPTNGGRHTA